MRNETKSWKLELTNAELTILQVALSHWKLKYDGTVFSKREIDGALDELFTYKYISQL